MKPFLIHCLAVLSLFCRVDAATTMTVTVNTPCEFSGSFIIDPYDTFHQRWSQTGPNGEFLPIFGWPDGRADFYNWVSVVSAEGLGAFEAQFTFPNGGYEYFFRFNIESADSPDGWCDICFLYDSGGGGLIDPENAVSFDLIDGQFVGSFSFIQRDCTSCVPESGSSALLFLMFLAISLPFKNRSARRVFDPLVDLTCSGHHAADGGR